MKSKVIKLAGLPVGMPQAANFTTSIEELPEIQDGQMLLKTLYFSVDPYLRAKMSGGHQPPLYAGDVMYSRGIAEVVESKHPGFNPGDKVIGFFEWREHLIHNGEGITVLDNKGFQLSNYLGVLGTTRYRQTQSRRNNGSIGSGRCGG
jgi:NADPH-dependent curcumin reductase CurA